MNILQMTGGLGNQMFGYALLLKLNSLGTEVKVDDFSEYVNHDNRRPLFLEDAFGIDYPKVSAREYNDFTDSDPGIIAKIRRKLKGRRPRIFAETPFTFCPEVFEKDNVYLTGYFQSDKYFADIEEAVFGAFTFRKEVNEKADEILAGNNIPKPEDTESVSIHIRRGDYLTTADVFGDICTEEYYDTCVRKISEQFESTAVCGKTEPASQPEIDGQNAACGQPVTDGERSADPTFYVFSNDPEWAENWAQKYAKAGKDIFVIKGTTEETGYIDLNLMSRCKHNIMANSSFSWWGAYLNRNPQKVVYAPKKWVNTAEAEDIYCDFMKRV